MASFLAALSVALFYLMAAAITSPGRALLLSIVYAFGTETWTISSQALWQHGGSELTFICTMLFLARYWKIEEAWPSLSCAGLFAGLSLAVRPTNALFVLAVFLWLSVKRPSWRALWLFSLFPVLVGLSVAAYNWFVFGNLAGLYADWTGGRFWPGFLGLLISPSRGLLVYSPVVLFSLAGVAIWLKRKQFMDPPVYFAAAFLHCRNY